MVPSCSFYKGTIIVLSSVIISIVYVEYPSPPWIRALKKLKLNRVNVCNTKRCHYSKYFPNWTILHFSISLKIWKTKIFLHLKTLHTSIAEFNRIYQILPIESIEFYRVSLGTIALIALEVTLSYNIHIVLFVC